MSTTVPLSLIGVDFTSAPSWRKPITIAVGELQSSVLRLSRVDELPDMAAFEQRLAEPGPWTGGFDFPFGLPRPFVDALGLGSNADEVITELHRRCKSRIALRALIDEWGNGRPAGQRLIHRLTDRAFTGVTSSSPLQTRYVPVGFMYYEGFSRLVKAHLTIPRLRRGDPSRIALEAYPGLLAFELIGRRSYKNKAEPDRLIARKDIVDALEQGRPPRLNLRLKLGHALREALVDDASGDRLDAVLCMVQAAWAATRDDHGMPPRVDPVEGWIVSAWT
jgi:hypothetical protein